MCSFLCVWCISSCELLMVKSFFFFPVYMKLKSRFFFFSPHRSLRSVNLMSKRDICHITAGKRETCPGELHVCKPCVTSPVEQQQDRGAERWFHFVTCPHRGVCPLAVRFDIYSFQVWAGRCLRWELERNPWLASHARACGLLRDDRFPVFLSPKGIQSL